MGMTISIYLDEETIALLDAGPGNATRSGMVREALHAHYGEKPAVSLEERIDVTEAELEKVQAYLKSMEEKLDQGMSQ
jgi:hypothetical protein